MFRKKSLGILAALAIALTGGLVAVSASPAMAQPVGCISGQGCFQDGWFGTGPTLNVPWSTNYQNGACHNTSDYYPYNWDGIISSVYDGYGSGYRITMYYDYWCAGSTWTISSGGQADLSGTSWNNHLHSFRILPG